MRRDLHNPHYWADAHWSGGYNCVVWYSRVSVAATGTFKPKQHRPRPHKHCVYTMHNYHQGIGVQLLGPFTGGKLQCYDHAGRVWSRWSTGAHRGEWSCPRQIAGLSSEISDCPCFPSSKPQPRDQQRQVETLIGLH